MPVPFTRPNEALQGSSTSCRPSAGRPPACRFQGGGRRHPLGERLRSTAAQLQLLSDAYPFTWHGNPA